MNRRSNCRGIEANIKIFYKNLRKVIRAYNKRWHSRKEKQTEIFPHMRELNLVGDNWARKVRGTLRKQGFR